jgi:two-component system cell cycle sensor histidine kinase/response regulator CckA
MPGEKMATVLVVDDEPCIRTMMMQLLKDEGYSVVTAGCGSQALSLFRSHRQKIDFLISDIVMPELDGPTLATRLRAECPGLPIILMSGSCRPEQLNNSFEFLPKPFSSSDLLNRLHKLAKID